MFGDDATAPARGLAAGGVTEPIVNVVRGEVAALALEVIDDAGSDVHQVSLQLVQSLIKGNQALGDVGQAARLGADDLEEANHGRAAKVDTLVGRGCSTNDGLWLEERT